LPSGEPVADVELSVVLPCLNEAETLETVIRKALASFRELGVAGEVVVADNGSTDGSQDIARAAGARVVDAPIQGYGAALRAGIESSHGTYVIMGDADDSYALDQLGPFIEALRGGADLVMGNRFAGGIAPGAMPWVHRYVGKPGALVPRSAVLPHSGPRLSLRYARLPTRPYPLARAADHRHGVRQRDGGSLVAGQAHHGRGSHHAEARWPLAPAPLAHLARRLETPEVPAHLQSAVAVPADWSRRSAQCQS